MNWTDLRQSLLEKIPQAVLPPDIKLPVLPLAVTEFSRKSEDPDVSVMELAKIVESDAGLTCELFRFANSSSVGLRTKVTGVKQALAVLGVRSVKLLLISSGVERALKSSQSKLINFPLFSAANLERALLARELAQKIQADADVAFAAAMLADFLLPALGNELLQPYLNHLETAEKTHQSLVQFERKSFGWDHALAMGQMMQSWSFPDDLVCAVLLHHSGLALLKHPRMNTTACAAVAAASLIPDPLQQSPHGLAQLVELETLLPEFSLLETSKNVQKSFSEIGQGMKNPFPLVRRVEKLLASAGQTTQGGQHVRC